MDTATHRRPCIACGELLPPHGAGKCKSCAAGPGLAGCPIAPHCAKCGAGFQFDPKGPMAVFNAPCRCVPEGPPVAKVCNACRAGQHVDCHTGIWRKADGSDPVVGGRLGSRGLPMHARQELNGA